MSAWDPFTSRRLRDEEAVAQRAAADAEYRKAELTMKITTSLRGGAPVGPHVTEEYDEAVAIARAAHEAYETAHLKSINYDAARPAGAS